MAELHRGAIQPPPLIEPKDPGAFNLESPQAAAAR